MYIIFRLAHSMGLPRQASSIPLEVEPMNARKIMTVTVAALVALSISATAYAATKTQSQSGTRTQIKSGTCVK